jgi:hypothetical protein
VARWAALGLRPWRPAHRGGGGTAALLPARRGCVLVAGAVEPGPSARRAGALAPGPWCDECRWRAAARPRRRRAAGETDGKRGCRRARAGGVIGMESGACLDRSGRGKLI